TGTIVSPSSGRSSTTGRIVPRWLRMPGNDGGDPGTGVYARWRTTSRTLAEGIPYSSPASWISRTSIVARAAISFSAELDANTINLRVYWLQQDRHGHNLLGSILRKQVG